MKRVIIVGSPRSSGRSAHLAEMLFEANIDERPEDELFLVPISEIDVGPCIGCNACRAKTEVVFQNDDGDEVRELRRRCVFDDDMQTVYDLLDEADELTIVCPVYFSGAPAPMKCLLDRLQPYFWDYRESGPRLPKRPLQLHIVGEGGDPHGFVPLISEVKGTTALAGFGLERILSWVGKIDANGEILAEAEDVSVPPRGSYAVFAAPDDVAGGRPSTGRSAAAGGDGPSEREEGPVAEEGAMPTAPKSARPKLDLSQGKAAKAGAKSKNPHTQAKGAGRDVANGKADGASKGNSRNQRSPQGKNGRGEGDPRGKGGTRSGANSQGKGSRNRGNAQGKGGRRG